MLAMVIFTMSFSNAELFLAVYDDEIVDDEEESSPDGQCESCGEIFIEVLDVELVENNAQAGEGLKKIGPIANGLIWHHLRVI